jgi:hypothetical protein
VSLMTNRERLEASRGLCGGLAALFVTFTRSRNLTRIECEFLCYQAQQSREIVCRIQ